MSESSSLGGPFGCWCLSTGEAWGWPNPEASGAVLLVWWVAQRCPFLHTPESSRLLSPPKLLVASCCCCCCCCCLLSLRCSALLCSVDLPLASTTCFCTSAHVVHVRPRPFLYTVRPHAVATRDPKDAVASERLHVETRASLSVERPGRLSGSSLL
jgi:hypothetical protein